ISRTNKFVAHTCHCEDEFRMLGVGLKLVAQAGDVHVDRAGQRIRVISPNGSENFDAWNRSACPLNQIAQELEFPRRKVNGISLASDFAASNIDLYASELVYTVACANRHAAQQNLNTGNQFGGLEGFSHVIVTTQAQPYYFIGRLMPSA